MSQWLPLLLIFALAGLYGWWRSAGEARERALVACRRLCDEAGVQLLDATVGLTRLRLRQGALERCYRFEYSRQGNDREPGVVWMRRNQVVFSAIGAARGSEIRPGR